MRKLAPVYLIDYGGDDGHAPRVTLRSVLVVLLGLSLLPLLFESAQVCAANWQAMYGRVAMPETPILDTAGSLLRSILRLSRGQIRSAFENLPWKPSLVITVGVLLAAFMTVPLRQRSV
jgi:hypothetical protein